MSINRIDCETCDNLNDGDIAYSVMICAVVPGGCKDICQGDSSGPIFGREGKQAGVVS
jgi:secreted trypsin-like serine protease